MCVGVFVQARKRGMSIEESRAEIDRVYPPTLYDLAFADGESAEKGVWYAATFADLLRQLGDVLATTRTAEDLIDDVYSGNTKWQVALDAFATMSIARGRIAAVLGQYGYNEEAGKAKLIRLYHDLLAQGGGQWSGNLYVPAVVFLDPTLLELLLRQEAEGSGPLAWTALSYCDELGKPRASS